jgi:hypothetical protein
MKNGMCSERGVCVGVEWNAYWVLVGKHSERDNLEDNVVVGRIILKYFKMGKKVLEWIEVALGRGM